MACAGSMWVSRTSASTRSASCPASSTLSGELHGDAEALSLSLPEQATTLQFPASVPAAVGLVETRRHAGVLAAGRRLASRCRCAGLHRRRLRRAGARRNGAACAGRPAVHGHVRLDRGRRHHRGEAVLADQRDVAGHDRLAGPRPGCRFAGPGAGAGARRPRRLAVPAQRRPLRGPRRDQRSDPGLRQGLAAGRGHQRGRQFRQQRHADRGQWWPVPRRESGQGGCAHSGFRRLPARPERAGRRTWRRPDEVRQHQSRSPRTRPIRWPSCSWAAAAASIST